MHTKKKNVWHNKAQPLQGRSGGFVGAGAAAVTIDDVDDDVQCVPVHSQEESI